MQPSNAAETSVPTQPQIPHPQSATRALLHAWFVEYNPAYLASAALVLAGLTLVSYDLAADGALAGLGVAAVAELYALALIASAAFLRRVGSRRVAVMVGLLAALYQCDLTLHVETSAFLGWIGAVGAIAWAALFALKLRLLAAALELRPSTSALLVPTFGAAGLALLPQLFRCVAVDGRTTLVALVGFAVAAAAVWTSRTVASAVGFDYRGRRAVRGTWLMWAAGALLHVAYWCVELGVEPAGLLPAAVLLAARWVRRERALWVLVLVTTSAVALAEPSWLPATALLSSAVLALRALRSPVEPAVAEPPLELPYRGAGRPPAADLTADAAPRALFAPADQASMHRLLLGALASLHLAAWTTLSPVAADAAPWLPHVAPLDLGLALACIAAAWRLRHWQPLAPLAPVGAHLAIQLGWVTAPSTAAQWGTCAITLGFALLGGGLTVSWRAHRASDALALPYGTSASEHSC